MTPRTPLLLSSSLFVLTAAGVAACGAPEAGDGMTGAPAPMRAGEPVEPPALGVNCPSRGPLQTPVMPTEVAPPGNTQLFLRLYAEGTQKYVCQMASSGAASWTFKAPEAQLYDDRCVLVGSHFGGPTWKITKDGSEVVGKKMAEAPASAAGAIPWLLLATNTTSGAGTFGPVTYLNRIDTLAGVAPTDGCDASRLGQEIAVPYSATYLFYRGVDAPKTAPGYGY